MPLPLIALPRRRRASKGEGGQSSSPFSLVQSWTGGIPQAVTPIADAQPDGGSCQKDLVLGNLEIDFEDRVESPLFDLIMNEDNRRNMQ
jgi:hypothetical protein